MSGAWWRYVRLYAHFLRFSFSKAVEFRFDFVFRIFMDFIYYAIHIAYFTIVFRHTDTFGGWNQHQMNIFLGTIFVADGLHMTLFSNNLWFFPLLVNKGDFDYFLLRPVSPLFMATLREVAMNSAVNLIGAVALWGYFIYSAPMDFGVAKLLTYGFFLLIGVAIGLLLRLLFVFPVFWTQAPRGFEFLYYGIYQVSERPDRIYKGVARFVFTSVLPFGVMFSYPARILLDPWSWQVAGHMIAVLVLLGAVIAWLWKKALRSYGSASS